MVNKVKTLIIACLFGMVLCSCASVRYSKSEEGEEVFKYTRVGNQKISGFKAEKNDDGTMKVELKGQESDASNMMEAFKNMTELAKRGAMIP